MAEGRCGEGEREDEGEDEGGHWVGSEWHLLSSSRLEQAVYEHHPSDNADANADAARHGVSLCAL